MTEREATEEEWEALQNVNPRVVTLDIEVDDRGEGFPEHGEERILSVVAHDSYDDQTATFIDSSDTEVPPEYDAVAVPSEAGMLRQFAHWFQDKDPDLVTGWNADDFDIPFLIKRFQKLDGLDESALARGDWAGITNRGEPRMKGRTVYDLLTVYKKNQFTKLRSYTLDHVAKEELGEEKIEFEGTYWDFYQRDPETFLDYNKHDVDLAVRINNEADVIGFRDVLRREVGVDFEDSYDNKDFIDMMCRRKLNEWGVAGPTRPPWNEIQKLKEEKDYEGAFVFEPYTGVAKNVVGIDLASLYPYTMAMFNTSPDTKLDGAPANWQDADVPVCQATGGTFFELGERGILTSLVDDAINLKAEYKSKRNAAEDDAEYKKWAKKYNVAKTITNSIYGVAGWEPFFLYDEAVAEAVTLTGQTVIKRTAEYVEDQGYEIVYGDTDSTYVKFPDEWDRQRCLDTARGLCEELNYEVYPDLAESMGVPPEDNMWEIEVEAYMDRFFQAGRKKRYAYLATWKDGRLVEDPSPSVSGFSSKRSDTAELTVETEEAIFDAILTDDGDVEQILFDAAQEIMADDVDLDRIGIPGGMNNKIDPARADQDGYYAFHDDGYPQDAHPRAVWNSNHILDLNIQSGDKPMRVYLNDTYYEAVGRSINVLAFITGDQIDPIRDEISIDKQRMLNVLLVRPFEEVASAIGVDVSAAIKGQTQTGLGAFGS